MESKKEMESQQKPEGKRPGTGNVHVVCRMRPLNQVEISEGGKLCVEFDNDGKTVKVVSDDAVRAKNPHKFAFDRVFQMDCTQAMLYDETAKPIIESVLDGFNGTIFAYGQTGSGKTHTMLGDVQDIDSQGIIPRMVRTIFTRI